MAFNRARTLSVAEYFQLKKRKENNQTNYIWNPPVLITNGRTYQERIQYELKSWLFVSFQPLARLPTCPELHVPGHMNKLNECLSANSIYIISLQSLFYSGLSGRAQAIKIQWTLASGGC